jgi:hypothetical protein
MFVVRTKIKDLFCGQNGKLLNIKKIQLPVHCLVAITVLFLDIIRVQSVLSLTTEISQNITNDKNICSNLH